MTAAAREPAVFVDLARAQAGPNVGLNTEAVPGSAGWTGPGTVSVTVEVPRAGRYEIWAQGNTGRALTARVDGEGRSARSETSRAAAAARSASARSN